MTVSVFAFDNAKTRENLSAEREIIYYEYSFYASAKYLHALFYELGYQSYGNIEVGSSIRKFFCTADFSFGKYQPTYYSQMRWGFGFSGGGRITPVDWFSIILGGHLGFFDINPYTFESGKSFYHYKLITMSANTKLIFGSRNIKFEISNKAVFPPGFQGSAGIVYMATKTVAGRNYR
jgi:hypothetical protein